MAELNWHLLHPPQFMMVLMISSFCGMAALAESGPVPAAQAPANTAPATGLAEEEFLRIGPLPDGIEKVGPIQGAVNVPFADCEASWPEGYKAFRAEDFAVKDHARKRDIYAWLRAKQAFEARNCTCAGKIAPWEPVEAIYAGLVKTYAEVQIKHTAAYDAQANQLTALVEKMCGGRF